MTLHVCPDILNIPIIPDIPTIPEISIIIQIISRLRFQKCMTLYVCSNIPEILNIPDIPVIPEIPTIPEISIIIKITSSLCNVHPKGMCGHCLHSKGGICYPWPASSKW